MNRSKQKGTRFESDVVAYLRSNGFPAVERRALAGSSDRGDIAGVEDWVLECKAERAIDLGGYMNEVRAEMGNAGSCRGAAIVKRRNHPVADAYAVVPLHVFVSEIISRWGVGDKPVNEEAM